jgi:hypothetical protein
MAWWRNVFRALPAVLLRLAEVRRQHENCPIDGEVIWRFVEKIQAFINAAWYDPAAALQRGSFV